MTLLESVNYQKRHNLEKKSSTIDTNNGAS